MDLADLSLLPCLMDLIARVAPLIKDPRVRKRLTPLVLGVLCGKSPKTLTSVLEFNAECEIRDNSQDDWSADYRFFSQSSWELDDFFNVLLSCGLSFYKKDEPIRIAIDDTILNKTGKKIPGTAYARDPKSPPFNVNLVWSQRIICVSLLIRASSQATYRSIPICFQLSPSVRLPKNATEEELREVKEIRKKQTMSAVGRQLIDNLRSRVDSLPEGDKRKIIVVADGSFANRTFLIDPPHDTIMAARCRNDLNLKEPIPPDKKAGQRKYGDKVPTPLEIGQDGKIPNRVHSSGVKHQKVKVEYKWRGNVRWPTVLKNQPCGIIAVKGQSYQKGGKDRKTKPMYLVVTGDYESVELDLILETVLVRWEIEVGFREQKNWLGIGKAQVWNKKSVKRVPGFMSACYSMLLMAGMRAFGDERTSAFSSLPKWRSKTPNRPSMKDYCELLKREVKASSHKVA